MILKVNINSLVFVAFSHFFPGDANIIVYIYLICIFVLIIRRKYHYYSMFGLSVFVVKV